MDKRLIHLYNDYIHGNMTRRQLLSRASQVAGGAAAAGALLPMLLPNYAMAQQVDPKDEQLITSRSRYEGQSGPVKAYVARPARAKRPLPGILVIHENRGLNPHIEDVARRAALAGFVAVAPDGLSLVGGAPADQEAARDAFYAADISTITADIIAATAFLKEHPECTGRIGSVGFCYGGGVALQCAVSHPPVDAAVLFYGRALTAEQVDRVKCPLMLHYAGSDPRVNASIPEFRKTLDAHGVAYSLNMYPETGHGFHNDASQPRYNEAAATLAWRRTMAFFNNFLG